MASLRSLPMAPTKDPTARPVLVDLHASPSGPQLKTDEGVEIDDYDAQSPAFEAIRARATALIGRINACGDYDDTMRVLAGERLRALDASTTSDLGLERRWLAVTFLLDHAVREEATRGSRGPTDRPSTLVYELLRRFLLGDDSVIDGVASIPRASYGWRSTS